MEPGWKLNRKEKDPHHCKVMTAVLLSGRTPQPRQILYWSVHHCWSATRDRDSQRGDDARCCTIRSTDTDTVLRPGESREDDGRKKRDKDTGHPHKREEEARSRSMDCSSPTFLQGRRKFLPFLSAAAARATVAVV